MLLPGESRGRGSRVGCHLWGRTELDMEQQTGSELGKEKDKAVYFHPAYLTYTEYIMQNAGLDDS